ncbi:MAG TPA: phosphatase PAP2 family protein [Sphingomicrobium sp.]|nr:phosphatase PAP2 family protein [Sphingomicrobium sp.]
MLARGKKYLSGLPFASRLASLGKHEVGILIAVFICASLLWAFGMIADEVVEGDTHKLDMAILMSLRTAGNPSDLLGPPWFEEMMRDVTALGSYAFIIIVVTSALGYLLLVRKWALAALMLGAVLGGMLISNLLKMGFDRPRPDLDHAARVFTPSFPSGHAMLSAVTFLTLGALLTRASVDWRAKVYFLTIAVILTIIVGFSRIYLGVHYPSDVLAGWFVGSAWALICWSMALWLQSRGQVELPSQAGDK